MPTNLFQRTALALVFLAFLAGGFSPLFAQETGARSAKSEDEQPYSPLERELLFEYQPLLAFRYNALKAMKGFHFSFFGLAASKYLANGLPEVLNNDAPFWRHSAGFGWKFFLGNVYLGHLMDWQRHPPSAIPAQNDNNDTIALSSNTINIDLGYAVFRNDILYVTPFVGYGTAGYYFDTPQRQRVIKGYYALGGGLDVSAFFPLFPYPFTPLEERKLGIRDVIEANLSLRAGYARYFSFGVPIASAPLYQELSLRFMLGVSMGRFVDEIESNKEE